MNSRRFPPPWSADHSPSTRRRCSSRISSARKDRPVWFDLPEMKEAKDAVKASAATRRFPSALASRRQGAINLSVTESAANSVVEVVPHTTAPVSVRRNNGTGASHFRAAGSDDLTK
jgi:hypothetical protein